MKATIAALAGIFAASAVNAHVNLQLWTGTDSTGDSSDAFVYYVGPIDLTLRRVRLIIPFPDQGELRDSR